MNRMLKFIHKKTGTILNMSILLALILFVGFLYGTLYENYCGDILSRELTRLLTIARSNATYMQFYYQDLHEDCRAFLEDNEFSTLLASGSQGAQEEIRGDLNRFFSLHSDDYLYAAVMDGGGEILCSAGIEQESIPPEILSMPFGNGVYERGFWMDADTYAFAYCSRIYQERELVGALIGVLDFSAVARRLFRYVRIGKKGNLSVCDAEGIVLLHSDKQMLGKKIYAGGARDDAQTEEDVLYIEEALAKKERGKAVFSVEESGKTEQMLMAFSRANIAPSYYMVGGDSALQRGHKRHSEHGEAGRRHVCAADVCADSPFAAAVLSVSKVRAQSGRTTALNRAEPYASGYEEPAGSAPPEGEPSGSRRLCKRHRP